MKNVIELLIMTMVSLSCTMKIDDKSVIQYKPVKLVKAFNLLDQNAQIPNECKPPLASESNKRAFVEFRGKVNRCIDLVNQSPELGTFENIKECLFDLGNKFTAVDDPNCRTTVTQIGQPGNAVEIINLIRDRFYSNRIVKNVDGELTFVWDEVENYFSIASIWFEVAQREFYPNSEKLMHVELEKEVENNIVRRFWNDLQAYSIEWKTAFGEIVKEIPTTDEDGNPRSPEDIREIRDEKNLQFKIFENMMIINNKVLEHLFASDLSTNNSTWNRMSGHKFPSPILASMLGEAINPFMQRMRSVLTIYDINCKLNDCDHSFYINNRAFWILNFFHALITINPIYDFEFDSEDTSPIRNFMGILSVNQDIIKSVIAGLADAFEISNMSSAISGNDMPHMLSKFKWVFDESIDLKNNYNGSRYVSIDGKEKAGLFTTNKITEVNIGFSKNNVDRHVRNVTLANEKLISLRQNFNSQKHTLIQEVLNLNNNLIILKDLESKINIDLTEMMVQKNQIDAVRSFISENRNEFSKTVKGIVNNPEFQGQNGQFAQLPPEVFDVAASSITNSNDLDFSGAILRKLNDSDEYNKGEMIQFSVKGQWSLTCAIQEVYGENNSNALTGPRGFTLIQSNGKSEVNSVNKFTRNESFNEFSMNASLCSPSVPGGVFRMCTNFTMGDRRTSGNTKDNTKSSSTRSEASFNLGLTLPMNPFVNAPSGALLFVEVPKGSSNTADRFRVEVVHENSVFMINRENSDYYLVGNDCATKPRSGSLNVTMVRSIPQGSLATQFVNKIVEVSSEIEARVAVLIENGQLTFNILDSLKQQLRAQAGSEINSFTGQMRSLLESFISNEVAVLDYKSQLVKMERALETRKQRVLSLLENFGLENEQRKLRVHTRNWLLSNLDLDFVNTAGENQNLNTLNRILYILDNSLLSYIDFRFRNSERDYIVGDTFGLSSIEITDSFDKISSNISIYVQNLLQRLEDDLNSRPILPKASIGVRIKNPFYETGVSVPFPDDGLFPELDAGKAHAFWDSLVNPIDEDGKRKQTNLNISIEDIYTANGLACYTQAPIIESFGMYFVPENEGYVSDYNSVYSQLNSKYFLKGISRIPFENGPRDYNFVSPIWRFFDVANRMAISSDDAMNRLATEFPANSQNDSGLATGRPLFGEWQVGHIPSYRRVDGEVFIGKTPIKEIKEVFLGFIISAKNQDFNVKLNWINYCSNQPVANKINN